MHKSGDLGKEKGKRKWQTNKENNDENSDKPVGENNAKGNTNGDSKHQHGLKQQRQIMIYNRHILRRMSHP